MHSRGPGILERTARLPTPAHTSTSTTPGRCIAEDLLGGCPSSAPAPEHLGPERKASSPRARIAARGLPLASESHSKFPAGYDAEGDSRQMHQIPALHERNRGLLRSAPLRAPAALAAPNPPLR